MKPEYDLSKMKSRPNPFASQLKKEITLKLSDDLIDFFQKKATEKCISYQEIISLYLQDCMATNREITLNQE